MINIVFIDSFNNRKSPRSVCIQYAEKFFPQTWSYGSDNDLNIYCSYSENINVVSLKEIVFWS